MNRISRTLASLGAVVAFGISATMAAPANFPNPKIVDGVEIYLGLLPAEPVRGEYPKGAPESSMRSSTPKRTGFYHMTVSLLDNKSKSPISNAQVTVQVGEIGRTGESKKLESMRIGNAVSYGNYFKMAGTGPYRIRMQIQIPGAANIIKAQFERRLY